MRKNDVIITFLFFIVMGVSSIFNEVFELSRWGLFYLLNISLGIYLIHFVINAYKKKNTFFKLLFWYIVIQFGLFTLAGNLYFFVNQDLNISPYVNELRVFDMNKSMLLACLGAIILINIFNNEQMVFNLGVKCALKLPWNKRREYRINHIFIFILMIILIVGAVFAVSSGYIGFADADFIASGGYENINNVMQYIYLIVPTIQMVTCVYYYYYLKSKWSILNVSFLLMCIYALFQVVVFTLAGMKSLSLRLFVECLLIFFLYKGKINKNNLIISCSFLYVLYNYVETFRNLLRSGEYNGLQGRLLALAASITSMLHITQDGVVGNSNFIKALAYRLTTTEDGALVIRYKDEIGITATDPNFLSDFLLAPIATFLPRIFFPWKSVYNYGEWCTHMVYRAPDFLLYGSDLSTHGYFYLAGGILFVVIGYIFLGYVLNFCSGVLFTKDSTEILKIIPFVIIIFNTLISTQSPTEIIASCLRSVILFPLICRCLLIAKY